MPAWIVPVAMGVASLAAQLFGQRKQNKENRKLAEFQNDANTEFQEKMLEYNTPASQMGRFQDAGLNPRLIYGQGNPGNQSAPQQYPDIKAADYQRMGEVLPLINQTRLADTQVQATNSKIQLQAVQKSVGELQRQVLEKNPLLDKIGFDAIMTSLTATAQSKLMQSRMDTVVSDWFTRGDSNGKGVQKLDAELKLLEQKYDLGTTDQKIKSEILKSKEFQNSILDVQERFLRDGDIGAQQIFDFMKILLMKLL